MGRPSRFKTAANKNARLLSDHTGRTIGMVQIISYSHHDGVFSVWNAKCKCGRMRKVKNTDFSSLLRVKSCDCIIKAASRRRNRIRERAEVKATRTRKGARFCRMCKKRLDISRYFNCIACVNTSPKGWTDYDQYDWGYHYHG